MSKIIIAGDLCPRDRVASLFDDYNYSKVLGAIKPIIEAADYSLVNLEAPIVMNKNHPIRKVGPNLRCNNKVVDAIKFVGFNGVTLANNHFFDYGEDSAANTINELSKNKIDYIGAGKGKVEARRVLFKKIDQSVFAFINCCEHEYSIVTDDTTGSNPLDIIEQFHTIKEAKTKAQYVIVIVHGGIEHYQHPTPRMVKTYRFFIEAGADAVVNHHQHCYCGFEYYMGKPIVYGVGNFCFDSKLKEKRIWHEGYLAELTFDNKTIVLKTIPYKQCGDLPSIEKMEGSEVELFHEKIKSLNKIIADPNLLQRVYDRFLANTRKEYDIFNPYTNKYLVALYKRGLLPSFVSNKKLRKIQNRMMCESHYERLLDMINHKL